MLVSSGLKVRRCFPPRYRPWGSHAICKDAGYEYVNIDDCWSDKDKREESTGRLLPNLTRFPEGIKGTADQVHKLGLKIGIYSSAGTQTCAGYPASIGYESIDAATWAEWGIDYLKYDNCNVPSNWTDTCADCVPDSMNRNDLVNGTCTNTDGLCPEGFDFSTSNTAERFRIMRDALLAQNRTILYSLCEWGYAGVQQWGNSTGSSWYDTLQYRAVVSLICCQPVYESTTVTWLT